MSYGIPFSDERSERAKRSTWGGKRAGAGRPKKIGSGVPHLKRPSLHRDTPAHVTLRVKRGVWNLRSRRAFSVIRRALHAGRERFGFRLVEYSVQGNHLHLIAEARDARALGRGVQGLSIRLAKGLNRLMSRKGSVFRERYHTRTCRTPLQMRRVLLYVLNNRRRHAAQRGESLPRAWVDEFSSAPEFRGWCRKPVFLDRFATLPAATVEARSFVLRIAWRRYGLLEPSAVPGPRDPGAGAGVEPLIANVPGRR